MIMKLGATLACFSKTCWKSEWHSGGCSQGPGNLADWEETPSIWDENEMALGPRRNAPLTQKGPHQFPNCYYWWATTCNYACYYSQNPQTPLSYLFRGPKIKKELASGMGTDSSFSCRSAIGRGLGLWGILGSSSSSSPIQHNSGGIQQRNPSVFSFGHIFTNL